MCSRAWLGKGHLLNAALSVASAVSSDETPGAVR